MTETKLESDRVVIECEPSHAERATFASENTGDGIQFTGLILLY